MENFEIQNKDTNMKVDNARKDFDEVLSDKLLDVKEALPENFNKARFVQNSLAFISTEKGKEILQKYGKQTIGCLLKGAFLGLDFLNKECYLVPFGKELNFMIDYRGAKKLCKKYSVREIEEISAEIVKADDEFSYWVENGKPMFSFKPKLNSKSNMVGAFAYVLFKDGGVLVEYVDKEELDKIKSKSKTSNRGAWVEFPNEMYKKCVIHRLCKGIEIEFDKPTQKEIFDEDVAIETDVKQIRENEVEENANKTDFTEILANEIKEEVTNEI